MQLTLRHQRGDTIVEVLISIAIISLVLTGAYAITNVGLKQTQDANERSQALQLAEKQIELLRAYAINQANNSQPATLAAQCLDDSLTPQSATASDCNVSPSVNASCATTSFCYNLSATGPIATNGQYEITVKWPNQHGSYSTVILDYKPPS